MSNSALNKSRATSKANILEKTASSNQLKGSQDMKGSTTGLPQLPEPIVEAESISRATPKQRKILLVLNTEEEKIVEPVESSVYFTDDKIEGCFPLFITGMTQDLFKIKIGDDVSLDRLFKVIPKSDLMSDIQARLAISDFYPAKKEISDFTGEEIVVHYDPEYKYGQNFFITVTESAFQTFLHPPTKVDVNVEKSVARQPKSRVWKSLGSEKDIEMERVKNNRDLMTVKITRKMADFASQCKFGDRDAHDGFLECRPYRDPSYDLARTEISAGIQAVPEIVHRYIQTPWYRPVNFACQYEPVGYEKPELDRILGSPGMEEFVQNITVRFQSSLQQNALSNIFRDHYLLLGDEETALDRGSHTVLQEFQSFTDLKNSKGKCISCIDWHPIQKGILAVSCTRRDSFDDRVEHGFNVRSKQFLIIIWSFHDPIHPQLILESPEDIHCFKFNPVEPHLVAAGCSNGQIVMWDLTNHQDKLKSSRKATDSESGTEDKRNTSEVPIVRYDIVSSIEVSHRAAVTDLQWLPQNFELGHNGEPIEGSDNGHKQILTSSLDGTIAFWDTRYKKEFKALDLSWRPFMRVPLSSLDNTYDYSITKVAIRSFFNEKSDKSKEERAQSAGKDRNAVVKNWSSKFYCTTEEGDLIYADWNSEKAADDKANTKVEYASNAHWGPISDLQRSPFFPDIILSVGAWSFHIWKEKTHIGSLLSCAPASTYLVCGRWSPTRPGVFYIGRADGTLEVWDILDRSHSPSMTQNITSTAVSYIEIHQYSSTRSQQYLAAGDDSGTLHIFDIPKNLAKPSKNEKSVIGSFFDREAKRLAYAGGRKTIRVKDKARFELEFAKSAQAGAAVKALATAVKPDTAQGQPPADAPLEQEDGELLAETDYDKLEHEFLESEGLLAPAAE